MATFSARINLQPSNDNPFYISASTPNSLGKLGLSQCCDSEDAYLNVLPNCVGYACGRFNEIIGEMKYPSFNCNAKNFIKRAREYYPGLQIASVPTLGGILVWAGSEYGHVAVVEQIAADGDSCVISESNWGRPRPDERFWRNRTLYRNTGWACYTGYTFLGCIVNPAVEAGNVANLADGFSSGGAMTLASFHGKVWPNQEKKLNTVTYKTKYKEVVTTVTRDTLSHTDADLYESKSTNLLSYPSLVESPFIIVKIGDNSFGSYSKEGNWNKRGSSLNVQYPNFLQSLTVTKVNGTVNQYTINMTYQIQHGEDPNFLDKVFSSVGYGTIYISYGDWMSPSFIYKEEEAIITNVTSSVDFSSSRIDYVITCTSNALSLYGGSYNFPARKAKPSDVIKEVLFSNTYGMKDIFYGMTSKLQVNNKNLIASDDQKVEIEAKESIDPISYINYLVTCMTAQEDSTDSPIKTSTYFMTIHDDIYGEDDLKGPYFKVTKVKADGKTISSKDTYEVDIGYPGDNLVTKFNLRDDNSWSLLYNYSDKLNQQNYTYEISDEGEIITTYSPALTTSSRKFRTTAAQKSWWTNMTQFPVSAELTIKGLVRPATLMTYIRVNAFFYGQRHVSSGLYIITKQEDKIDGEGYRSILSLTRVAGDQDWYESNTETITTKVPYYVYN